MTIFQDRLILQTDSEIVSYHRVKYVLFKTSPCWHNEISHYYLYLKEELPAFGDRISSTQIIKYAACYSYINTAVSDSKTTGAGHTCPEEKDLCLSQKPAVDVGFAPQPSSGSHQLTWNPTNHSRRLSTADASFQPITAADSVQPMEIFDQSSKFSQTVLFKANIRKSLLPLLRAFSESLLRITSALFTTSLFWYHETLAAPAAPDQQAADTCITKQQTPVSPSYRHQHFPLQLTRSCNSTPVYEWLLCLDCHQHSDATWTYPRLTKDWINRDIDHPASTIYASISSTVSSYVHEQYLYLRFAPSINLLDTLSPRTYTQPSQLHSTALTFNTAKTTQTLYPCAHFVFDSLNKELTFKTYPLVLVICLVLSQSLHIYKYLWYRRIYRPRNTCLLD